MSTVVIARTQGIPRAGDDAGDVRTVGLSELPARLVFDPEKTLADSLAFLKMRAQA